MLVQDKYKKKKSFSHTGILSSLSVPTGATVGNKKFDLQIDGKSKTMKLGEGKSAFVISDVIGISELTEIVLFFLDDVMVLELVKGYIYVPTESGEIQVLNSKNKINVLTEKQDKIIWKNKKDLLEYCSPFVKHKFNLNVPMEINDYVNNLMFHLKMSYYANENCLFSFSILDMFYGLGIGKFSFEIKEPLIKVLPNSEANKPEVDEYIPKSDSFEDSVSYRNKKGNKYYDKYSDYDSDDYFYPDEEDVLPSHMHEVDIYSEYEEEVEG